MGDLWRSSATEIAALIARGEVSSSDAVAAHIERIEAVDGMLNAVVVRRFDDAMAEARRADEGRARGDALGPLHGVPMTIKECFDLAGTPSTFGLTTRTHDRATSDDPYVARLRAAGAIVIAKTNLSQLMIFIEADNPVYGRTNNPWNIGRTCGGSSGGEGAIVAAGGSPLGLGTDIGGSLRNPANYNGIVSMKPTAGRLDDMARLPIFAGQDAIVSQAGPLARTVADVELAYSIASGAPASRVDLHGLRVGYYENIGSFAASPALARATREAAALLGDMGASVVRFEPPAVDAAMDLFYGILAADRGRGAIAALGKGTRDKRVAALFDVVSKSRAQLALITLLLRATGQTSLVEIVRNYGFGDARHYWDLVAALAAYRALFARALDEAEGGSLDALVSPPGGLPAILHGASGEVSTAGAYAPLYNVLGYPAGTIPFTRVRAGEEIGRTASRDSVRAAALASERGSAGLPAGVQIVARPGREDIAFSIMAALETVARSQPDFPVTPVTPTYDSIVGASSGSTTPSAASSKDV
jgi:fatty acid amide hydrolase